MNGDTKVITATNWNRYKQQVEVIRIPSCYPQLVHSTGKGAKRDWFCFLLIEKLPQDFSANRKA